MSVRSLLASLVFHPGRVSREAIAAVDPLALVSSAEQEQVVPQALRGLPDASDRHHELLRASARRWVIYEELQHRAVGDLLDRMGGVPSVFFKGASLAYGVYGTPADRMRLDWDLLVPSAAVASADRALRNAGFVIDVKTPLGIRFRQQTYRRPAGDGECAVDLHTGVFNAPALADRIRFEPLLERSIPLPALHASARGAGDADALVLAALHRLMHHAGETRLIWDNDIRMLATRLAQRMSAVEDLARAWGAGPLVAVEIMRAFREAGDDPPDSVRSAIDALAAQTSDLRAFAVENRARSDDFAIDWRTLGWRGRLALARQTFFPAASFVRASSGSSLPLPVLYLRRILRGARAWFRRPRP